VFNACNGSRQVATDCIAELGWGAFCNDDGVEPGCDAPVDPCARACLGLELCGLCVTAEGECIEFEECIDGCQADPSFEAAAECSNQLKSCDGEAFDECLTAGASGPNGSGGNGSSSGGATSSGGSASGGSGTGGCTEQFFYDGDEDGFGDPGNSIVACAPVGKYTAENDEDCCDADATANPDQTTPQEEPNSCGDFDYNCDNEETFNVSLCGSAPSCEEGGSYWSSCPPPPCGTTNVSINFVAAGSCLGGTISHFSQSCL
jgi:hypothetical protein